MKNIKNNQKGFSLLEITVSLSIFSLIMVMATSIFQSVIRGQQSAIASQNTQEGLRYVFEVMSKEVRNAKKGGVGLVHECDLSNSAENRVFNKVGGEFFFKNKDGYCIYYYLNNDVLMVHRYDADGDYTVATTPDSIIITDFDVSIYDNEFDDLRDVWVQPYVTIRITAKAKGHEFLDNETKMQTTISSRMYE